MPKHKYLFVEFISNKKRFVVESLISDLVQYQKMESPRLHLHTADDHRRILEFQKKIMIVPMHVIAAKIQRSKRFKNGRSKLILVMRLKKAGKFVI